MLVGTGSMAACTTDRWYFTREQLLNSPSRKCQIEPERELSYRQHAANLIQDMGQRLQVNQLCINTAIVYMHRFYVFHSFSRFQRNSIAAAALFLAAKVEEQPHKLEYVIKVHHACLHRGGPVLDTKSDAYLQQAQELVINESILLQTLALKIQVHVRNEKCNIPIKGKEDFVKPYYYQCTLRPNWLLPQETVETNATEHKPCIIPAEQTEETHAPNASLGGFEVAVDHPHTHVVKCTQMIRASKDLAQTSYFMATNSLHLTTFCLQYKPTVVACVCIYLVAKWSQWEIMKSSDGKDWWEYVDPTVTKELLDELTKEFLRIFEACPSRLKRRISNEKIPVMPHQSKRSRLKEGASDSQSSSTAKTTAASSASTSSVDSGLPGNNSFDGFMNSQDNNSTSQGDGQGSLAAGDTETDRPGLYEINMGLPMVESSLFSLDTEYMGGTGYNVNPGSDSKHGLPGSQSDSEYGKMGDQQGHPVKVSLKEYREQKERERMKTAKQIGSSKVGAPPRTSHTVSRPSSQNLSGMKGNVNSPHTDAQRSRDKFHSQGSQKQRPDDRKAERQSGTPLEPSSNPHTKAPGRPPDLKHSRDQRPHSQSQHRPNDLEVHAARGATVTESRYSKNSDQYHKPHQEPSKNNSDRKQQLGQNSQEREHKRNGFENKDHGANSRPPEGVPKIPSSVAPSKTHGSGPQRHHHLETQKAHSSVKLLTAEPLVKQNPETLRPVKPEAHRSQRSENQVIQKSEKHRAPHPDMAKLHKSQSLKPQRFETPKAPSVEKHLSQPAVPPLVPLSYFGQEQKVSDLPTQKVEPPLPIDHELPKPQRPERVLLPQTETVKVEKSSTPILNRHNMTKPHKSEDPHLQRPEVLKVPKSDPVVVIKTEPAKVKSPGSSKVKAPKVTKVKGPEAAKVQKSVGHKLQKTETLRLSKTDAQIISNNDLLKQLKTDTSEISSKLKPIVLPIKMLKQEPQIPPPPVVKVEKPDAPRTQKPQPPKSDPSKRQRIKVEPGQPHRITTQKPRTPPLTVHVKLESKSPPLELTTPSSPHPKLKALEMAVLQADLNIKTEILDQAASSLKGAIHRKPQTPPSAKLENPLDKTSMPSSLKPVTPKQSDISNSYIPDKAKLQRAETVTPLKADTDKQHKPLTPKSQKSTTPRSRASPGASSQTSKPSKGGVSETPKVAHAGGTSDNKVVWESIKPLEVLKSGGSDQAPDTESVETDIDELINADIAALSKKQGFEPPTLLEPKPSFPEVNTVEPKEKRNERDKSSLPKSYREKESHHRKRHSDEHRSKSSSHKHHRSSDHNRRGTPNTDAIPSPAEQAPTTDAAGDSQPHSILTTSTGIRLKIKGLSNSMNSGSSNNAKVESPSDRRQTGSPALRLKLNLAKVQANSDHPPEAEITPERERASSHRQHHHHHRKHKHHKSRSQRRGEDGGEPHRRKRSHSRSDSVSSGREESPAISSPAKKRAHSGERYFKNQSILPNDQSLLRFPMPPSDPNQSTAPGYMDYNKRSHTMLQDNSPSLASTGQFSYNTSGLLHNAPLTTVTALPSSDGFSFYPYSQQSISSDGHLPPPPPPLPRDDLPPPPPPPM